MLLQPSAARTTPDTNERLSAVTHLLMDAGGHARLTFRRTCLFIHIRPLAIRQGAELLAHNQIGPAGLRSGATSALLLSLIYKYCW